MQVRQSDLKQWQRCPLAWRFQHIDNLPREQSGALTFGSIIHECVLLLETSRDVEKAVRTFEEMWDSPESVDPSYKIDYFVRGTNWKKYLEKGRRILRDWWGLIQWESDVVLAREYEFDVPIGDGHVLHGTVDKLALRLNPKVGSEVILVSDYKSNAKTPTYEWLADDLQFTAYCFATTRPEFWGGIPNGMSIYENTRDRRRWGEWVSLESNKRLDAGERTQVQYNRLEYAINAMAESVAMRIFVPNISGETCRYCDFRKSCGLPDVD